ncbi:MAG: DUF1501 domain-containing protein [Planctomycetes bacterium]|nr:DUF1501 domain-containing protein [Planctomycetota bacterium]
MSECACSRRDFLRLSVGMSAGAALAEKFGLPLLAQEGRNARAKYGILLWMPGAPSQLDTWDPKPGAETGGPFQAIDTAVAGVRLSEHLPRMARQMKRVSLIRTVHSKDLNHDTATYLLHTAYRQAADVEHPHLASVVASELGIEARDMPPSVVLGGAPPVGAGYLSPEVAPLVFDRIDAAAEDVLPGAAQSRRKLKRRWEMLQKFEKRFAEQMEDRRLEQRRLAYQKAYEVLTSARVKAFNVRWESDSVRAAYGDTEYGRACLMARRLIEADVRFVEVMYGDWDTHRDNFDRVKELSQQVDRPMAALLEDLAQKGLLKETLVVIMGEFGRTPRVNAANGRDHWPTWSVALAGGGIEGGRVIGKTDESGLTIVERPVRVSDLYATMYRAFGIDPEKKLVTSPRPMKVVEDGTPVQELF